MAILAAAAPPCLGQSATPLADAALEASPADLHCSVDSMIDSIRTTLQLPEVADDIQSRVANGTLVIGELQVRSSFLQNEAMVQSYGGTVGKHTYWGPNTNNGVQVIGIRTDCTLLDAAIRLLHELDHLGGCGQPGPTNPVGKTDPRTKESNPCGSCQHAAIQALGFNRLSVAECEGGFNPDLWAAYESTIAAMDHHLAACGASGCPTKGDYSWSSLVDCCEAYVQMPSRICP